MLGIYQQLQERNARETDPFILVHQANATLLNQVDALQLKCDGREREISTLEQQIADGSAGTHGPAAATAALKNETRLRDKLEQLQEELNSKLKQHAADQADALKTAKDLAEQKDLNQGQEATIHNLRKECNRKEKVVEHLTEQLVDAKARTKLAEQQYVGLKETIRSLQKENDQLKKEKSGFEARLVADKGKMVDEMNLLTEMVESLKREVDMLRSLNAHDEKRKSGGWFGRSSSAAETIDAKELAEKEKETNARKFGMLGTIVPSEPKQVIQAHTAEVTSARYDSMGSDLLVTAGADTLVKVWDVGTGTLKATLRGPSGHTILGCDIYDSLVAGAASDKTCRIWNMKTERMIHHLVGHNQKVTCVRFFENGNYVITGSADRSLKVWDIRQRTYRQTVTMRHGSTAFCVDAGSNGVDVVTGHHDGGLRFWDTRTGERTLDIKGLHENSITSVQFHPIDSTKVLTNGLDSCLKIVDVRTGTALHTLRHPHLQTSQTWAASAFSANGAFVAVGSSSTGDIFVWSVEDGMLKKWLEEGHSVGVAAFAWGRGGNSGQQVASVDRKGCLILWA